MDKYGQMSKWDGSMVFLSVGVILVLSLLSWFVESNDTYFLCTISVYSIMLTVTLIALWFVPLEVSVSSTFFRISFPMRRRLIPVGQIKSASVFDDKRELKIILGSRWFFGWWGRYSTANEGKLFVYASNLNQLVLVRMKDGSKYLVSCSDAKIMANCINSRLGAKITRK